MSNLETFVEVLRAIADSDDADREGGKRMCGRKINPVRAAAASLDELWSKQHDTFQSRRSSCSYGRGTTPMSQWRMASGIGQMA